MEAGEKTRDAGVRFPEEDRATLLEPAAAPRKHRVATGPFLRPSDEKCQPERMFTLTPFGPEGRGLQTHSLGQTIRGLWS